MTLLAACTWAMLHGLATLLVEHQIAPVIYELTGEEQRDDALIHFHLERMLASVSR